MAVLAQRDRGRPRGCVRHGHHLRLAAQSRGGGLTAVAGLLRCSDRHDKIELLSLTDRALVVWGGGATTQRLRKLVASGIAGAIAGARVVTMVTFTASHNVRRTAFGLSARMAGASLLALTVHELKSERIRHELEVAQAPALGGTI